MSARFFCRWRDNMQKRASVAIISLWVLILLAMLAVGVAHRVITALRLSRYQKDGLNGYCLAKAGINLAIAEILNDPDINCDSLQDLWRDNEDIFKEISLNSDKNEIAVVSYIAGHAAKETTVFGAVDEESKININTAPAGMLEELFNRIGASDPAGIANNICAWRGDAGAPAVDYQDLGYVNKGAKFSLPEELLLVKGVTPEIFQAAEGLITVYGNGLVNINTAGDEVMQVLGDYCVKAGRDVNFPMDLALRILDARQAGKIFSSLEDLNTQLGPERVAVLSNFAGVKSTCFCIVSDGRIEERNFNYTLEAVFNRFDNMIVYWHEN